MYKLAFIGGSHESIAGYPHFIASQMDMKFKVFAGAFSTNPDINKKTAEKWNIKRLYDNWEELILKEKNNIDAVVILSPTFLHADMIIECLSQNIPVITEKPITSSLEETIKIKNFYDKDKHFLVVTNNYSGYPMVRELKERIKNHELGKILKIKLEMPQESFLRPPKSIKYPQKWRLKNNFIPMISLDLGIHLHHLSYFLTNKKIDSVLCNFNSFSKYNIVDDVNMLLEYTDGTKGEFWISKTALGNRNGLTIKIYGEKASAVWIQEEPEKLNLSYSNGDKLIVDRGSNLNLDYGTFLNRMTPGHPSGFIEAFANLYNNIYDSLTLYFDKKDYVTDKVLGYEHALDGMNFLHSASVSNEEKKWISLKK